MNLERALHRGVYYTQIDVELGVSRGTDACCNAPSPWTTSVVVFREVLDLTGMAR